MEILIGLPQNSKDALKNGSRSLVRWYIKSGLTQKAWGLAYELQKENKFIFDVLQSAFLKNRLLEDAKKAEEIISDGFI